MSTYEIFLDWDGISYKEFRRVCNAGSGKRSRGWMLNRLNLIGPQIHLQSVRADYRKSAGGRVHVRLQLTGPEISVPDQLVLRTFLDDDRARVYLDIVRWCRYEDTNRLFDSKYSGHTGKIGHAGPWIPWIEREWGQAGKE